MARAGGATALAALLSGGSMFWQKERDVPIVRINEHDELLSDWASETYHESDLPPDCKFWNFSIQYDASLCSHFVLSRASATPARARVRAQQCAIAHSTECVLSPEVGLALPAAFLNDHATGSINMLLAPRLAPYESPQQHVRVAVPTDTSSFAPTRTFLFNTTIKVDFLDGESRNFQSTILEGEQAYCVQLLREAFEPLCWKNLD